jgi:hypothetical protein
MSGAIQVVHRVVEGAALDANGLRGVLESGASFLAEFRQSLDVTLVQGRPFAPTDGLDQEARCGLSAIANPTFQRRKFGQAGREEFLQPRDREVQGRRAFHGNGDLTRNRHPLAMTKRPKSRTLPNL